MKVQIKNRIIDYFHNRDEIIAVYAFGSQVRGNTREDSDIDIGVLLEATQVNCEAEKRLQYQADLSRHLNGDVHIVVLNKAGEALLNQIFGKGECILVNDSKKLSVFKMVMISRIADFRPKQEKMQTGFINHFMREETIG